MSDDTNRLASFAAVIVGGLAAGGTATADDIYGGLRTPHSNWSLFADVIRTDNATLLANGPSDTIANEGVSGSFFKDSGRFKVDADGSVRYEDYLDHTFKGATLGSLVGTASYALVPERLNWVVQETYGQVNSNPLQPTTPANRINANYASTGPDANLRLGGTFELMVGARYAQAYFQSNPRAQVNDQQVTGDVGVVDRLSPTSSLALIATSSRIEYRIPGNPSYTQQELFGRFDARSPRGGIALDLGVTQLRDNGSTVHSPLLRLTAFHRLTPSWNVNAAAGLEYRNSGQALQSAFGSTLVVNGQIAPGGIAGAGQAVGGVADINLTRSVFRSEYGTVAFDFVRPRTRFEISAGASRERYQFGASIFDRDLSRFAANFTYRLRPTLDLRATGDYERRKPLMALPADRSTTGGAEFVWRPGTLLVVTLGYAHDERSTDAGGFGYRQNRVYLGLAYGPPVPRVMFEPPGRRATSPPPT